MAVKYKLCIDITKTVLVYPDFLTLELKMLP